LETALGNIDTDGWVEAWKAASSLISSHAILGGKGGARRVNVRVRCDEKSFTKRADVPNDVFKRLKVAEASALPAPTPVPVPAFLPSPPAEVGAAAAAAEVGGGTSSLPASSGGSATDGVVEAATYALRDALNAYILATSRGLPGASSSPPARSLVPASEVNYSDEQKLAFVGHLMGAVRLCFPHFGL
jgi:hypothetical protein